MAAGDEILETIRRIRNQGPIERMYCPNDGYPLTRLEDGTLHCAFDGWTDPPRLGQGDTGE
ncbi:hypothetical protein CMI37_30795 [Candidatus Pacearchaeota archaeon]|nr:hypothetical protein [Candidatus Pacearchaeota archaeon]